MDWDGSPLPEGRRSVRARPGKMSRRGLVDAQRRALRQAARSMITTTRFTTATRYPGELKGVDTAISWPTVPNTTNTNTNIQILNGIAAGTGSYQRVGRKVISKSLRISGYAECNIVTTAAGSDLYGNIIRFIVVWDKQPSGAAYPNFDAIFGKTNSAGVATSDIWSPPAYNTMDRFRVLKDWMIMCEPDSTPTAGNVSVYRFPVECYLRLANLESNYSGPNATETDVNTGSLYLIARCITNDATATTWGTYLTTRLRYVDP